ncbi:hypothetical protein L3Y34_017722 [Caenorhabditis briggsae]|uniref:Uncharacterized protein n=1 Tax=Caenorhabditis briggsae TaxID=6238 RepID=A0AAE9DJD7_CAEBR|nr:hypothetical protein L3Y34_017722 [Caenorhabditis briggsae]
MGTANKKSTISARSMRSAMSTMPSNSRIRQDFNNRIGCNLEVHGVSGRMSGMSGMSPMSTMTTISRTRIFSKFSLPTVMALSTKNTSIQERHDTRMDSETLRTFFSFFFVFLRL